MPLAVLDALVGAARLLATTNCARRLTLHPCHAGSTILVETLPAARPWDGERTVTEIGAELRMFVGSGVGGGLVGVHVRTDTNHPMFYFDQTHLLPDNPRGRD